MYVTLTNATPGYAGEKIAINSDSVLTVLSKEVTRESGQTETVTFLHCPPHGTWEVQEPLVKVVKLLNAKT
jgi:hypothetical protein